MAKSLDSLGLLAQTTEDLRIATSASLGRDLTAEISHATVLTWPGSDVADIASPMSGAIGTATDQLAAFGVAPASFDLLDHVATLVQDHPIIMAYEAHQKHGHLLNDFPEEISPQFRTLLTTGRDISNQQYWNALSRTRRTNELFKAQLKPGTVILGPAAQDSAPYGLASTGDPVLSRPWQALGYPALTVPGARNESGLPLGLQLISLPGDEAELFAIGQLLEQKLIEYYGGNESL